MADNKVGDRSDGYVSISISDDKMEAFATFHPSAGEGRPLERVQAESALTANNITYGVIGEAIDQAIEQCNNSNKPVYDVLIAKGLKPVKASPAHINLKPEFFNRSKTVLKQDGSVDFKESSPFLMVKKGEPVGRIFSYRAGTNGKYVTGEDIPFKNKEMQIFHAGENLEAKGEVLISQAFGRFVIEGDNIWVTELLEVSSDVDYHTGNISFAGDIIINGVVHDGFRVAAGGSIHCKQLIKNAEVLCRGDLQLDLGLKGRESALVRVNGMIQAKFIEYGTVESKTGINVSTSLMTANIYTLGKLSMGQKGIIVTSEIIAEKGIVAFNIGRERCAPSHIECGVSFVLKRKLENLKIRHDVLLDKIVKLQNRIDPPVELIKKMQIVQDQQEKEIEKLKSSVCTSPEAQIRVVGTVFAGTEIKICKARLTVEEDRNRVTFKLDEEKGKILIEPLSHS